jgi:hypothetical protein
VFGRLVCPGVKVAALRFRLIINVVCVWSHARLIPISSRRRSGHSASTPQILSAPLTRPEEAQVEAERPGELIAPGLRFAHAMTREPRTVAPHHDISARQRTGARLSDRYARALKLRIDGTRGSACLQSDGRRSEGVFSRDILKASPDPPGSRSSAIGKLFGPSRGLVRLRL